MNGYNSCFECVKEFYSGKKETFFISAPTKEDAVKKARKENPTCYVKIIREVKF